MEGVNSALKESDWFRAQTGGVFVNVLLVCFSWFGPFSSNEGMNLNAPTVSAVSCFNMTMLPS